MNQQIPPYLRLPVDPYSATSVPTLENLPELDVLCDSFRQATGWTLRYVPRAAGRGGAWSAPVEDALASRPGALMLERGGGRGDSEAERAQSLWGAGQLAWSVGGLLADLQRTRRALWQREAELAAGIPIRCRANEEHHLAVRLEAVLRGGVEVVDAQAAALYLLDDATSQLKLRAGWGLPPDRLVEAARPLQGAVADLEALLGSAVVLEDTGLLPHWQIPENYPAAACVPVSSPTMPLGTLWVFSNHVRDFTERQTQMLEIVAGRLAAELERELLLQTTTQSKQLQRQQERAIQWQQDRLPRITPLLDDWQLAGWTSSTESLGSDFYDWGVLPDGALMVTTGGSPGTPLEAALSAATLHATVRSHSGYGHTPSKILQRVNDTLWTGSAGDQFGQLFYGRIEPDTGELEYANAGTSSAWLIRPSGPQPLVQDRPLLGSQPDSQYPLGRERIARGELLVVLDQRGPTAAQASRPGGQQALVRALAARHGNSACEVLRAIRTAIEDASHRGPAEYTVLVVKRR